MPPSIQSVQYIDPFAPQPVGISQAGILVAVTGGLAGQVAYAQLQADGKPLGYAEGTSTGVQLLNPVPLVTGPVYLLLVQYALPFKPPPDLNWASPAVMSAPVVIQQPRIVSSAQVTGNSMTVTWEPPPASSAAGALIQLVDLTTPGTVIEAYKGVDRSPQFSATLVAGHYYGVRISAMQPIASSSPGTFAPPFTVGPPTPPRPVPPAGPTLTRLDCAEIGAAARWTVPGVPQGAGAARYEILLLDNGKPVMGGPAGDSGGQLVTGELTALTSPQLAGRVNWGSFTGPIGASAPLFPVPPQITAVSVTGTSSATITAQLAYAGAWTSGGMLIATLYKDGVVVDNTGLPAATGQVSLTNVSVAAGAVYAIDVAMSTTYPIPNLGRPSPRLIVPLIAPTDLVAKYDGQQVRIDLNFPAGQPVDGYQVTLTGSGTGRIQLQAGPQLPITFNANLDLGQTWTATVVPKVGIVSARTGTGTVTLPVLTAPVLTRVGYDGAQLSLQWTPAKLPYLTGYRVAVSNGGPTLTVGGDQTNCVLPLTLTSAASVTVTGLSAQHETAASVAVPILISSIQVSSVVVGSQVVASWPANPAAPAVRAVLMLGGSVASIVPNATATGVSFQPPAATIQPYTLVVYPVSADGVAVGPASAPVPLILTGVTIESGQLDGAGGLSLRWSSGSGFGATGYRLAAAPSGSSPLPAGLVTSEASYTGPAPAAFSAPGTITLTPIAARSTGPSVQAAVRAPVLVSKAEYLNGQLIVDASLSNAGAGDTDTSWLDVLLDGAVLARKVILGKSESRFTLPVVLPAGAAAAVRASIVGPSTLTPASVPVTVPTRVPSMLEASYANGILHIRWLPTVEPGVTGYWVSVTGTGGSVPDSYVAGAGSDTTTVAVNLSYPFPSNAAVSVRAAAGAAGSASQGLGQPSTGMAPTLAGNSYSVAVATAGYPPYLYRRGSYQTLAAVSGQPIVLYLVKPFAGAANPTVPSTASPWFQLAPAPAGSQLPYKLTLSAAVWSSLSASPVRTELRDAYNQFLIDVEAAGVTPWAILLIRQLVAQAMPQTFEEVLYYRYGYWRSDSLRVVDLTPGTRLQLSNALYQAVVGGVSEKNGFLAAGAESMDVVEAIPQGGAGTLPAGAGRILSVDALLSLLYPGSGSAPTGHPVAAGPLDFFADGNRQSYYRLFFPQSFPPSASTGSTALTSNITLVGTTSWATLTSVTAQYQDTGTFPTGLSYFTSYFRGRSGLTPLINLSVQGESRWVALGSSVRQALTSIGLAPYASGTGGTLLSLRRAAANLFSYPTPDAGLALDPVELSNAGLNGLTPLYWPLDMPVVGGDQLTVRQLPGGGQPA